MRVFYKILLSFSRAKLILYGLGAMLVVALIIALLQFILVEMFTLHFEVNQPSLHSRAFLEKLLIGSLIVPLIETLLLQLIPMEVILSLKVRKRAFTSVLFASILFAVLHSYSMIYIGKSFLLGFILAMCYLVAKKKGYFAYGLVTIIHSIFNLFMSGISCLL
ncbi:CPBP family glutamic-type intramembrane protease [Larkinella soli]|uniref:CPBP family glutamic-type intramembrane protease n=1 Tax=Larkinella soli TaxID=1770527 RepID=UPI000FFCB97E|nr:hypothetical protein [Larkinella soli]